MRAVEAGLSGTEEADNEGAQLTVSRRALIAGLVAAAAIGKPEAAPTLPEKISTMANELAALMQELHGGAWHAAVDHDVQIVMVAPGL